MLVTNLIVVAPVLLLARRWRLPFGTVTLLAAMGAVGLTSLREFALGCAGPGHAGRRPGLRPAGRPACGPAPTAPGAFRVTCRPGPAAAVGRLDGRLRRSPTGSPGRPELWAGVLGMASLTGLGLSVLVLPPAVPAGTWEPISKA